jgi:hypothetical protein
MENNPFASVVKNIRNDSKAQVPALYRIGTVESVNPFIVNVVGIVHDNTSFYKNTLLVNFLIGDQLLLIPIEDEQRYIILCKAVSV